MSDYEIFDTMAAFAMILILLVIVISLSLSIFTLVCKWKVNKKAGREGWACLVPIYDHVVRIEMAGLPLWYLALIFVPYANIYAIIKINIELAHKFKKSTGFGVGLAFIPIVFEAILAFDKDCVYDPKSNGTSKKYCINCGNVIGSTHKFCQSCGSKIEY